MNEQVIFQVVPLGEFDPGEKKAFSFKPRLDAKRLFGAFLFSPGNENFGQPASATLRLMLNNRSFCAVNMDFPLSKEEPEDTTPRGFFDLNCTINQNQVAGGYVTLAEAVRKLEIKLYLMYRQDG
jgi:hypothetical protein